MKIYHLILILLTLIFIWGCSEKESPVSAGRTFSGITERDEWGDTLSVDPEDWVIVGGLSPASGKEMITLPYFRDGKRLEGRELTVPQDQIDFSIGAFPNPFIPSAGRLLIELVMPESLSVELHAEDESGGRNILLFSAPSLYGVIIIPWDGTDETGENLPEGIYRIFFRAGFMSSFGDVEVIISGRPDPPANADYVLYAQGNFNDPEYIAHEYWVATQFGWDGQPGGSDTYLSPLSSWESLGFTQKFEYLPIFMNYDLSSADFFQHHYLLAYKHFQFGAGWPAVGNDSTSYDPDTPEWAMENDYHEEYVELYEGGS